MSAKHSRKILQLPQFTMKIPRLLSLAALCTVPPAIGADQKPDEKFSPEIAELVKRFNGRGALGDKQPKPTPAESLAACKVGDGLALGIVAPRPMGRPPLNMHF